MKTKFTDQLFYAGVFTGIVVLLVGVLSYTTLVPSTSSNEFATLGGGDGTINQLEQWKSDGTNITQRIASKPIKITGLSDGCLSLSSSILTSSGSVCGSGGGGGSGTGTWATTTSTHTGRLINYPLNTTDIVVIGGTSTTTAASEVYFDPNTENYKIGSSNTASTTIMGILNLPTLSAGGIYVGSAGKVNTVATSTLTPSTGLTYSGTMGSMFGGSSGNLTVNASQNITTLSNLTSNGIVYTAGGTGVLNTVATSTFTATGLLAVTAGAYVPGGTPIVVSCATCGVGTVTGVTGTWPILSSGGATPNITYAGFGSTTDTGVGNNLILYTSNTGIVKGVASSSLSLPNAALQNSTIGLTSSGSVTITGSPIALGGSGTANLNMANANSWTALQTFQYSTSTIYSSFLTASTTFLNAGSITVATTSAGCAAFMSTGLLVSTGAACGSSAATYAASSVITSNTAGVLIATGTQLTVGNILATTTAVNQFNGVIVAPDGTLSNPAFSFADDQNNGIFSPANDVFAILTNGVQRFTINDSSGYSSFGTTTQGIGILTLGTSTAPQLTLSSNTNAVAQWAFRNAGGNLYLSTTTVAGTATTSTSALSISGTGFGTTTLSGLTISGFATSTSNVGSNISGGCYAIAGNCIGAGSFTNNLASGGTGTTTFYSGGVVYSDGTKLTQSAAIPNFFWDETNKRLGLATSTPYAKLSVNSVGGEPAFVVGSSTATSFIVRTDGTVSAPGSAANSERYGAGAVVTGSNSIGIGSGIVVTGGNTIGIGTNGSITETGGNGTVAIGTSLTTSGSGSVVIGNNGSVTANGVVALGYGASVTQGTISIGSGNILSAFQAKAIGATNMASHISTTLIGEDISSDRRDEFVIGAGTLQSGTGGWTGGFRERITAAISDGTATSSGIIDTTWLSATAGAQFSRMALSAYLGSTTQEGLRIDATTTNPIVVLNPGGGKTGAASTTPTFTFSIGSNNTPTFGISTTTAGTLKITSGGLVWSDSSAAGGASPGGTGTELQYRSGASTFGAVGLSAYNLSPNWLGLGTTTPRWLLQLASSTAPQLTLSDGTNSHWTFRNSGGNLYIGTAGATTFATSTTAAITWTSTGAEGINDTTPDYRFESVGSVLNGFFALTNTTDGDVFNVASNGFVGIGSTTPWGLMSIASSTWNDFTRPLFTVATSSNSFGQLFMVSATTSRALFDTGSRVAIGTTTFSGPGANWPLTVQGEIYSTKKAVICDVPTMFGIPIADIVRGCQGTFDFDEDTEAAITQSSNSTSGTAYITLWAGVTGATTALVAAGSGGGIVLPANAFFAYASSSPSFEAILSFPASANSTSTVLMFGLGGIRNGGDYGTEVPTQGPYFVASSTISNWYAGFRDGTGNHYIDTGVASTSSSLKRFRIRFYPTNGVGGASARADWYINDVMVATYDTVSSLTSTFQEMNPFLFIGATQAGLAKSVNVVSIRGWADMIGN